MQHLPHVEITCEAPVLDDAPVRFLLEQAMQRMPANLDSVLVWFLLDGPLGPRKTEFISFDLDGETILTHLKDLSFGDFDQLRSVVISQVYPSFTFGGEAVA